MALGMDQALTPHGRIKRPTANAHQWIITAWQCISPEVTDKVFQMCCLSNAMHGSDDSMLWNDTEGVGNNRTKCEEDEGTDCEDMTMKLKGVTLIDKGQWNLIHFVY
jgi:hypothetical protein